MNRTSRGTRQERVLSTYKLVLKNYESRLEVQKETKEKVLNDLTLSLEEL